MNLALLISGNGICAENDRILLRRVLPGDKDIYMRLKHEVSIAPPFFEYEDYRDRIWQMASDEKHPMLAIVDKNTDCLVGTITIQCAAHTQPELAIDILKAQRRRSYAYDAISLLLQHSHEVGLTDAFLARIYEDNTPSLRLFRKFRLEELQSEESAFTRYKAIMEEHFRQEKVQKLMKNSPYNYDSMKERKVKVYRIPVKQ